MLLFKSGLLKTFQFNLKIFRNFQCRNYSESQALINLNTNVVKDVMLYKYDNPKFYRYLNLFGISQFTFWMYLSHFSLTNLKDAPVNKDEIEKQPWWRKINLGDQNYRNGLTLVCGLIGHLFLFVSWAYTIRSVRYLVLNKGGQALTFVTYGPFGKNSMMKVPISKISAAESRENARIQLPIKIKGKMFYYMVDMRGNFPNKMLFDATAGLRRNLK